LRNHDAKENLNHRRHPAAGAEDNDKAKLEWKPERFRAMLSSVLALTNFFVVWALVHSLLVSLSFRNWMQSDIALPGLGCQPAQLSQDRDLLRLEGRGKA